MIASCSSVTQAVNTLLLRLDDLHSSFLFLAVHIRGNINMHAFNAIIEAFARGRKEVPPSRLFLACASQCTISTIGCPRD